MIIKLNKFNTDSLGNINWGDKAPVWIKTDAIISLELNWDIEFDENDKPVGRHKYGAIHMPDETIYAEPEDIACIETLLAKEGYAIEEL